MGRAKGQSNAAQHSATSVAPQTRSAHARQARKPSARSKSSSKANLARRPNKRDALDAEGEAVVSRLIDLIAAKNVSAEEVFGTLIRQAIDKTLYGAGGVATFASLNPEQKTAVGTAVEKEIQRFFDFAPGPRNQHNRCLDFCIADIGVDCKCTSKPWGWMIPKQCIGELCLLVHYNDTNQQQQQEIPGRTFSVGLVRTKAGIMNRKKNQDKKATIAARGRKKIHWLVESAVLPRNSLTIMEEEAPQTFQIFADEQVSFDERIEALLSWSVEQQQKFPRNMFEAVDISFEPALDALRKESEARGLELLCGSYPDQEEAASKLGILLESGEFIVRPK